MTTSQPPEASSPGPGPAQPAGRGDTPPAPSTVRPAVLAGSVLALLTYLCGFFGASEFSFPLLLVLAGGLLALIGLLPRGGRVLVPASLLAATGFFGLLLQVTSAAAVVSSGAVRWVALALGLLSSAAIVAALMFDVGVLTAPAPRPPRQPAPQQGGWSPYGQPGYGAPGQPPPGQPGMFEPAPPGYGGQPGYGAPGSYGAGYGAPGQPGYGSPHYGQQPGYSAQGYGAGPSSTGGYGAVGAGGYGGAQGYGAQGYSSQGHSSQGHQGSAGYGAPAYGGQPGASGHGGPSGTGAAGQPPPSPAAGSAERSSTPPSTYGASSADDAAGDDTPEATKPGVPANGGDTLADVDDERTRSFRPGDGSSGSGS